MNKREFIGAIGASCLLPVLPEIGQSEEICNINFRSRNVTDEEMAKLVCAHSCMVQIWTSEGGSIEQWKKGEKKVVKNSCKSYFHPEYSWQTCSGVTRPVDHVFTNKLPEKHNKTRRRRKSLHGSIVIAIISEDETHWNMHESLNLSNPNIRVIELTTNSFFEDSVPFNPRYFGRVNGQWIELGV